MPDLPSLLAGAIDDVGTVPGTGRGLVEFAGGRDRLVRELSGMRSSPKRADYSSADAYAAARTRWRSAQRRVQRYTAGEGKQQRGGKRVTLAPAEAERVKKAAVDRKWAAAVRDGVRARMHAKVKIPTPGRRGRRGRGPETRDRTMPAGGPGVFISPDALIPVLEAIDDGDEDAAAFEFQAAFEEAYGFPNFSTEEVYELKVWPEGTSEP